MSFQHRENHLRKRQSRGQNVIEYLLVTTVVVLICFVFFRPTGGPAKTALDNILNDAVLDIQRLNDEIKF